jgi:Mg2+-importing ATPase
MEQRPPPFWSLPAGQVLARLDTTPRGLSSEAAASRASRYAARRLTPRKRTDAWRLLLAQFASPIVLILLGATILSCFLQDFTDAAIILVIVLASCLLGFWQERGAAGAVEHLLSLVEVKARVLRDGTPAEIPLDQVVPGDVVLLSAGATAPGDCLLLEERDLFADEATLTGETFPAEKSVAVLDAETPLARRINTLFLGTHMVSGSATAVVTAIGRDTEFGGIAGRLELRPPETDFEHGVRRFGYLLLEITLLLVIAIFAVNVYLHRPVLDSFLFSMALAVELTPQLLPAIVGINLAHGARRMAEQKVIVKRLAAIENFGSMNVLCTDKTGTITQGLVTLQGAHDLSGQPSERALLYAYLNASFESGFASPIDAAIRGHGAIDTAAWSKLDEVPYDFLRKRLSILAAGPEGNLMITKGALAQVLEVCTEAEDASGKALPLDGVRDDIEKRFARYSSEGQRTLGLACRRLGAESRITKASEAGMTFVGFLLFSDPPKPGIGATIGRLEELGVSLKVITGDNALVAATVARAIGLEDAEVITGPHPQRTHRPGLAHGRPGGGLPGRRDQRRVGAARSGRGAIGRGRGGRGQGRRRHRAPGEGPRGAGGRGAGGTCDLRQHAEVRAHGHQRQLRQHVQHGGRRRVSIMGAIPTSWPDVVRSAQMHRESRTCGQSLRNSRHHASCHSQVANGMDLPGAFASRVHSSRKGRGTSGESIS